MDGSLSSRSQTVMMSDAAFAVLLTRHHAWMTSVSPSRLLVVVPSEQDRGYWYYALLDAASGEIDGAYRPVHRDALAFFVRQYGATPESDWSPCERYLPGDPNPIFYGHRVEGSDADC